MSLKIPCDVMVAPATLFRKGVKLSTVIDAIRRREGMDIPPLYFGARAKPQHDPRDALIGTDVSDAAIADATIAHLSAQLALTREALDLCLALDPDGARAVLAKTSDPASCHCDKAWIEEAVEYLKTADPSTFNTVQQFADENGFELRSQLKATIANLRVALAEAREALERIDVIIETGKVNHAKVAQKVARAVLAQLSKVV